MSGISRAATPDRTVEGFDTLDLKLDGDPRVSNRALVLVPKNLDRSKKHRSLVLLHGYGQAMRVSSALNAWWKDYGAAEAHQRLLSPPLKRARPAVWYWNQTRLDEINAGLSSDKFEGFVLICPVTPVPYYVKRAYTKFATWLEDTLLPAVHEVAPVRSDPGSTGLVGHSMGGLVAIEMLIRKPHLFGSFSGVQLELSKKNAWPYATRVAAALSGGHSPHIQLHTATRDPYREAIVKLHRHLEKKNVAAEFRQSWGTHNRLWMQELGSVETLLWQDRVLRTATAA